MEKNILRKLIKGATAALYVLLILAFAPADNPPKKAYVVEFDYVADILASTEDEVYVLNFWATWCKPCVEEMPGFEAARKNFANQNVTFVYISLDFTKNLKDKVIPFVEKNEIGAKVVLLNAANQNEWIPKVSEDWSGAIPTTLIINPAKGKSFFHEGQLTQQKLEQVIKSQL